MDSSPDITVARRDDGSLIIRNATALPPIAGSIAGRLDYWAERTPDSPYLSEGDRLVTYKQARKMRRSWSARLLSLPLGPERPLMILGENGIDHAIAMLAATAIGVPVAVVTAAYGAAAAAPWDRLAHVMERIKPGLVLADDPSAACAALWAIGRWVPVEPLRDPTWLEASPASDSTNAEAAVDADTVAKLLFTSGSTGKPKAVVNTQRMLVSNMQALSFVWPSFAARPPVLVDWLPWSHTFGGNCCFDIVLWFGGHLHIDKGRPTPGLIERSIAAIRRYRPTHYFNVPIGYELLAQILAKDLDFAADFLGGVAFLFNAGAAMSKSLRAQLEAVGLAATGRAPAIVGAWGCTETAPFATALSFPTTHACNLGVPIPGTAIKLVPDGDSYELRVSGPNVTPGYWRDAAATSASFDDDGYYRTGDTGHLADPEDPAQGILFDGRLIENFKLASGTFVNTGTLRLAVVSACAGLVLDAVVAGEGRSEIGVLLFLHEGVALDDATTSKLLVDRLASVNANATGSSTRIARFAVAECPPSAHYNEITDKGYLNQRRILARRVDEITRLYAEGHVL